MLLVVSVGMWFASCDGQCEAPGDNEYLSQLLCLDLCDCTLVQLHCQLVPTRDSAMSAGSPSSRQRLVL